MEKEIVTDQSSKSESMTLGDEDQIGQLAAKWLPWKSDFPGQKETVRKADQMLASTGNKRICVWSLEQIGDREQPFYLFVSTSLCFCYSIPCLISPSLLSFLTFLPFPSLPLIFMLIQLNVAVYFHLMLEANLSEQSYRKTTLQMDLQPLSKHSGYVCLPQSIGDSRQKQPLKSLWVCPAFLVKFTFSVQKEPYQNQDNFKHGCLTPCVYFQRIVGVASQ